jgi:hypothetical protein
MYFRSPSVGAGYVPLAAVKSCAKSRSFALFGMKADTTPQVIAQPFRLHSWSTLPMTISTGEALNPYAAPNARVADVPVPALGAAPLFAVGLSKLALMSVCTFGLYHFFWFYRQWKAIRERTGQELNAPIRSFFYTLTAYFLFRAIGEQARAAQVKVSVEAGMMAIMLFILAALPHLPAPYSLFGWLGFLPLLRVQAAVNEINRKLAPTADPNTRLRGWNVVALVLGGTLLVVGSIGLFLR